MVHDATFEKASKRARAKQAVVDALAMLSREVQCEILAELILALEAPTHDPVRPLPTRPPLRFIIRGPGRPKGAQNKKISKTETVWSALASNPGISIGGLADAVYPGEDDAKHKVRAALFVLKNRGRAKNVGTGQWEAITPNP